MVIHLGGNDALSPADRTAVSACWLSQLIGKPLAQNGTRLAFVEAPDPVPEDMFGPTDPTSGACMDFVGGRTG